MRPSRSFLPRLARGILGLALGASLPAAVIRPSDPSAYAVFGITESLYGDSFLAGASGADLNGPNSGAAYLFRGFDPATGTAAQSATLIGSDATTSPGVGLSIAFNGSLGLLGRPSDNSSLGAVYVYRGLDTATGTVTEALKLTAPEKLNRYDYPSFGQTVALSGTTALIGAPGVGGSGRAYLYRNIDTAIGSPSPDVTLKPNFPGTGPAGMGFGSSLAFESNLAVAGAQYLDSSRGIAYVFRNLDTAAGLTTESLRLLPSTRVNSSFFGNIVSLSGTSAIVGAYDEYSPATGGGAAYLYRDLTNAALDTPQGGATPYRTETARLVASDGTPSAGFGSAIAFSGANALIGAFQSESYNGAVYLFTHLDTASGLVTESVRITASHPDITGTSFGAPSLDGDNFLLRAISTTDFPDHSGVIFSGSISSMTTLDVGHTARAIDQLSFTSRQDWTIGRTTDANQVTLSAGDRAIVTTADTAVYIGREAGADDNRLLLAGDLTATEVHIGSIEGNHGNLLQIEPGATFTAGNVYLAPGNGFSLAGDYTRIDDLLDYFGPTRLQAWSGRTWETVDAGNYTDWLTLSYSYNYTSVTARTAVPEPATCAALAGAAALFLALHRRRLTRPRACFPDLPPLAAKLRRSPEMIALSSARGRRCPASVSATSAAAR